MKISKLSIKNFRSIKELELNPTDLTALVWPNSTWKSNVMKAIDMVIWEWRTTKAKVIKELFNDTNKPIEIIIEFSESILVDLWRDNQTTKNIKYVSLYMTIADWIEAKVKIREHWYKDPKDRQWKWYSISEDFKKKCHFVYIPSHRDLSWEMRVSNWSMLGKLMKSIHENYKVECYEKDDEKLKKAFEITMKDAKDFLEKDFSSKEWVITFLKFQSIFDKYCKQNSSGLATWFNTKLNIYNVNNFYKTLQIWVCEDDFSNKTFDADEVWSGMQNLILLSIVQTYAELMWWKVIFWIEEPELYLYPQAQRELYKSFQTLSNHTQIFYTTHSQNFVSWYRAYDVNILKKNKIDWTYKLDKQTYINPNTADQFRYKIYTHFNTERNELFFARKIILVEGDSDKILYTTLCEKRWIDIDKEWCSIIECGGKWWVIYFLWVLKWLGITEYIAIWDKDNWETTDDQYNLLSSCVSNWQWLELYGNLEDFLTKKWFESIWKDIKVEQAHKRASEVSIETIPTEFDFIKDFIIVSISNDSEGISLIEEPIENIETDDLPF